MDGDNETLGLIEGDNDGDRLGERDGEMEGDNDGLKL